MLRRARKIDVVADDRFFHHAQRHDFESWDGLQLGKVRHREVSTVDRLLVALIEERRNGHSAQLREGIMDGRLTADIGKDESAARKVAKRHASEHDCDEKPARNMAAKHRRKANVLRAPC